MQYFSDKHAMARAYAEAGIPVFPCRAGGKIPVTENGFYDATTDPNIIDVWWSKNHEYNPAFCPASVDLFIIDVDPGADTHTLQWPDTYTVRTPRGGFHFYFKGTGPSTSGKLAAHIDTRSIGGYVLLPPSMVNGKTYIAENNLDYAPLPPWVSEKLKTSAITQSVAIRDDLDTVANIARAVEFLRRRKPAIEFQGSDVETYKVACTVKDFAISQETAFDLIWGHWALRCEGEWTEDYIRLKIANAYDHGQNDPGAYAVGSTQEAFGHVVKALPPEKTSRFYFKDETEQDTEPDPKWIIRDLISERSTVMMFGASGSYKSFLALDICLSVAMGTPAFGSPTTPGLVFYGALEGKAHLKKARRAWRILHGIEGKIDNFFVGLAPMIAVEGEVQAFGDEVTRRCDGRKPALIVIDTLSKSMAGMNENDAADAGKFIRFCDSLVEHFGCTVIAVHHNGKEENRGARGSSAFQAGFDTVLEIKASKSSKAVAVYVRKHKDAEERETPWTFEGRITGPSLTFEATTPEQHRLLVGDSKDITPKTVGAALKALQAIGEAAAVSTAVLATQVMPARENESVEDRAASIARTGRILVAEAKDALEAYCTKHGRALYWYLPASV